MAEKKKAEAKTEEMVEEIKEEVKAEVKKEKPQSIDKFIARKMKAINEMESPAKARRTAMRVFANRKVGK